jgi:Na+-driven multidrug efflux pump
MMFAFSIVLGIGQGFQPICGFNYGAKLYRRVRESYTFTMSIMTMFLLISGTLGYIFAPHIISFFRSEDQVLIEIGSRVLRWQCIAFPLIGLSTSTNMLLQTIRKTLPATILSMCRQGIFFLPILYFAPMFLGLQGVEMTQAMADVCTFLLAIPVAIGVYKKLSV